jgi:hypothetical protein
MSVHGTFRTCRDVRVESVMRVTADVAIAPPTNPIFYWQPPRRRPNLRGLRFGLPRRPPLRTFFLAEDRPFFLKDCDRARYRRGRCAPPLAVAYSKP